MYVTNSGASTVSVIATATNTVTVALTDTIGTSTTLVFTGQTAIRNGAATASASRTVTVSTPFGFVSAPGAVNFAGTITGQNQVLTTTMPLDVSNGNLTGWNLSATSTTWTTGGGSPHTLPLTATSVTTAPIVACDAVVLTGPGYQRGSGSPTSSPPEPRRLPRRSSSTRRRTPVWATRP